MHEAVLSEFHVRCVSCRVCFLPCEHVWGVSSCCIDVVVEWRIVRFNVTRIVIFIMHLLITHVETGIGSQ